MTKRASSQKTPEPRSKVSRDAGDIGERLARLETELKHLATKEELTNLKLWFYVTLVTTIIAAIAVYTGI